ncbi:MAG: hypothetical protein LCH26_06295 [Proteobacteria bacterium]|nr:hypothetical protein [Pseudomonadota bacterium]
MRVPTYTPKGTSEGVNLTISLTDTMAADPAVQDFIRRTGATTRIVHDTVEDIHTSQASLGMAPMLAIGVIMNMVLPGSSALMQLVSATVSCLAPKFVNGIVRDGTISGGVREATSSRALKDLVMTMFTPSPGGSVAGSLNLINHFVNAVESALWRLPLEAVLGEGSLQDIFTASALSAVANATCGFAASHIGELSHPGGSATGGIAPPIAVLLHGAVGAGMSAIQGRDILSGAVGAMVGEVSGMIYNRVAMADMGADHPRRAEAIQRGTDVARLTGIAVAGIGGLDPSAASCAAANAAGNNSLMLLAPPKTVAKTGVKIARGAAHAVAALTDSPDARAVAERLDATDESIDDGTYRAIAAGAEAIQENLINPVGRAWTRGMVVYNQQRSRSSFVTVSPDAVSGPAISLDVTSEMPIAAARFCNSQIDAFQNGWRRGEAAFHEVRSRSSYTPSLPSALSGPAVGQSLPIHVTNMLRLPETGQELRTELALLGLGAGLGRVLKGGAAAGRTVPEIAAMRSAVEQPSVLKYFGREATSATQAASSTSGSLVQKIVDPTWRSKIYGTAQKTKTKGHDVRSMRVAIEAAKDPNVLRVHMDHGVNRAVGLTGDARIYSNRRPDVTIIKKDGTVDFIEVPSRTDDVDFLLSRIREAMHKLPEGMQDETSLAFITKLPEPK